MTYLRSPCVLLATAFFQFLTSTIDFGSEFLVIRQPSFLRELGQGQLSLDQEFDPISQGDRSYQSNDPEADPTSVQYVFSFSLVYSSYLHRHAKIGTQGLLRMRRFDEVNTLKLLRRSR